MLRKISLFIFGNLFFHRRKSLIKRLVSKRTKVIQDKNKELIKQKNELQELNMLLEKRQKRIESQSLALKKNEEELKQLNELLEKRQERMEKQTIILKKHEEELEQLNELLVKRQKRIEKQAFDLEKQRDELKNLNATKDKLFSIIAHDLKNPFNTILGFTELVNSNFDIYDKEKLREINNTLYGTATHIYKLLENLLNWSRTQTGTIKYIPEEINLKNMVNDIKILLLSTAKEKNLDIIIKIDDSLVVKADKNMLHTILRNLVTNAIKFTDNGTVTILAQKTNGEIKISIIDTGIGMDNEVLENLFEANKVKSRTGTKGESGTGLGLIICKEFILKHHGKIWATSQPGKGTSMYITLHRY